MRPKVVYLVLLVLGVLVPYGYFIPWLLNHRLNTPLFLDQLHANPISEFFVADVMVSAAVVLALLFFERRRLGWLSWLPLVGLAVCGVSAALPLLLYLREPQTQQVAC